MTNAQLYRLARQRGYNAGQKDAWREGATLFTWNDVDYLLQYHREDTARQDLGYRIAATLPPPRRAKQG